MDELELSLLLRKEGYTNIPLLVRRYKTNAIKQNLLHLQKRCLDVSKYPSVIVLTDVVIFPLWNLSGQYTGYQQYRPNADKKKRNHPREGRYYTSLHGDKNEKPIGVWGLESYYYRDDVLFICEGIFDTCRLHNIGLPAVALLSSDHGHYKNWLTSIGRKIYKVEDDHGSNLGPYEAVKVPPHRSDLGECTLEEISQALCDSSFGKYRYKYNIELNEDTVDDITAQLMAELRNNQLVLNMLNGKPLEPEFAKVLYDNFWEMCQSD